MTASPAEAAVAAARRRRGVRLALAGLILANICLACGPWLVRLADVGPLSSGFWRLALAAPLLLLAVRVTGQAVPLRRLPWMAVAVAGLAFAADLAMWHAGILQTRLANATLIGNSASFFFPLWAFVAARQRPSGTQAVALLLAAAGVTLLVGRSVELSAGHVLGDLLCLGAALFYTLYLVAIDRARGVLPPLPALALVTTMAALAMLPLAIGLEGDFWPRDWTPLMLLALGSQCVGQGLIIYAMGHLSPLVVGLALLSQPVVAAAIGWIVYDERLTTPDIVGAATIVVALVLVRRQPRAAA